MATERETTRKRSSSERPKAKTQSRSGSGQSPVEVAKEAAEQLHALTGRDIEGVIGVQRDEDGWLVRVEVVESRRIPDSADVLAMYEAICDESGRLLEYRRVRRYGRGRTGDD